MANFWTWVLGEQEAFPSAGEESSDSRKRRIFATSGHGGKRCRGMVQIHRKREFNQGSVVGKEQVSSSAAAFGKRNRDDKSEIWNHYQATKIQSTH